MGRDMKHCIRSLALVVATAVTLPAITIQAQQPWQPDEFPIGKALNELVTVMHSDTLRRWIRGAGKPGRKWELLGRGGVTPRGS